VRGSVPNGTNPRPVDETTENGNLDSDNDNTRVGSGDDNNNAMEQDPPSDENDTEHGSGASGAGTISPPAGTLGTAPPPPSTRTSVIDDPFLSDPITPPSTNQGTQILRRVIVLSL
jgi:hypothetical protein